MTQVTLKGNPIHTSGELPKIGDLAPSFTLTRADLSEAVLGDFKGQRVVLNIFPSVDTGVCAASVRQFNVRASALPNTVVLCVSQDLPFAMGRFCAAEGLDRVTPLSAFRSPDFGAYGMVLADGPLRGLLARAVVVLDEEGKVLHAQVVPEITTEPDYDAALAVL